MISIKEVTEKSGQTLLTVLFWVLIAGLIFTVKSLA